ncbi:MAG: hypothetical protein IJ617_00880, partial [Oscillospiraceae bacterium]|nr:hypothetical protein [Oscillospiraceae bacterium]
MTALLFRLAQAHFMLPLLLAILPCSIKILTKPLEKSTIRAGEIPKPDEEEQKMKKTLAMI